MKPYQIACAIIALSQLVLGGLFLAAPSVMYDSMGIQVPTQGVNYILGMFAARLLVYGAIMLAVLRRLPQNQIWLDGMLVIQAIDLLVGLYYCAIGAVPVASAAMPMINAGVFILALGGLRPAARRMADAHAVL